MAQGADPSSRSPVGIAGSNPTKSMDVCVVCCTGKGNTRTEGIKVHIG